MKDKTDYLISTTSVM